MKTILAFCAILLSFSNVYSQTAQTTSDDDKVFTIVQQKPEFPGDLQAWLDQNIVYPKVAKDSNIQGTVFLSFIVEKDGSLSTVKIARGIKGGASLNTEALRVVSMMPRWAPRYAKWTFSTS